MTLSNGMHVYYPIQTGTEYNVLFAFGAIFGDDSRVIFKRMLRWKMRRILVVKSTVQATTIPTNNTQTTIDHQTADLFLTTLYLINSALCLLSLVSLMATGLGPWLDIAYLNNPSDKTQRSLITWCPAPGFRVALWKFRLHLTITMK